MGPWIGHDSSSRPLRLWFERATTTRLNLIYCRIPRSWPSRMEIEIGPRSSSWRPRLHSSLRGRSLTPTTLPSRTIFNLGYESCELVDQLVREQVHEQPVVPRTVQAELVAAH